MDGSYMHDIMASQHLCDQQENYQKRHDKAFKKLVPQLRNAKPTMALYRPPGGRVSGDFSSYKLGVEHSVLDSAASPTESCNSSVSDDSGSNQKAPSLASNKKLSRTSHVHFSKSLSGQNEKRSTGGNLKRSKSFGAADQVYIAAMSSDKDSFTLENNNKVRNACEDPNKMSSRQLMEVVKIICNRAIEDCKNAEPAAQLCIIIIEKEKSSTFVESLLNCCREWYNEKDRLLRGPLSVAGVGGIAKRWLSYVSFLSELYHKIKDRACKRNTLHTTNLAVMLNTLMYECFVVIVKQPSIHNTEEVECMYSILTTMGRLMEDDCPERMKSLMFQIRDAFLNVSINLNTTVRKILLELIEMNASRWQFDRAQNIYYFPYTVGN